MNMITFAMLRSFLGEMVIGNGWEKIIFSNRGVFSINTGFEDSVIHTVFYKLLLYCHEFITGGTTHYRT